MEFTDAMRRTFDQVKVLFPHMSYPEREEWITFYEQYFPTREEALIELTNKTKKAVKL